jgi:hypothetical protein
MINIFGIAMDQGDLATWITGFATIALFIVGFFQIRNEREVRLSGARRNQAEHIATWIAREESDDHGTLLWIAIRNQSLQPIYNSIVQGILLSNDGAPRHEPQPKNQIQIAVIPPGDGYAKIRFNYQGMGKRAGIEIAFQDAAGRYWLRQTNGELQGLDVSPMKYYQIPLPIFWGSLLTELPKIDVSRM